MPAPRKMQTVAEQAAEWMVLLTCDDPGERARAEQGFRAWRAADTRHAQAAARIEGFLAQVDTVRRRGGDDGRPARAALDAARAGKRRRRTVLQAGAVLTGIVVLAGVAGFSGLLSAPGLLQADLRSSEREWLEQTLSDGTRISLSGASAIKLRFDASRRTVELLGGDIRVDVAKDTSRPFVIETPDTRIRALGTRFLVSYANGRTDLEMFESQVVVENTLSEPTGGPASVVVQGGQRVQVTRQGIGQIESLDARRVEAGWQQRQLILDERPLPEVLAQLARHRPGASATTVNRLPR
ncbi:FecR family protein [Pigmentiphaga litoralis]|uniref:FecR family protein n=1 Tax=Pigmentiphaga litoralis TaxID=516702 RepID=UPI003B434BB9